MNERLYWNRHRNALVSSILFVGTLLIAPALSQWSGHFATKEYHFSDEGIVVYAADRASHGNPPHLAFPYYYSGGLEILLGFVFHLVGPGFSSARWLLAVSMSFMVVFTYLLHSKARVGMPISVVSAVAAVIVAHLASYHIHPAWIAMSFILAGVFFLLSGVEGDRALHIVLAGICMGIATSIKQSTGLYALAGSLLFVPWCATVKTTASMASSATSRRARFINGRLAVALLMPLAVMLFFLVVLRTALIPLNLLMFCLLPCAIAGYSTHAFWKSSRTSAGFQQALLKYYEHKVMLLCSGFILGFLPIVLYYTAVGGLHEFFSEAFMKVHGVFTKQQPGWEFTPDLTSNPLTGMRRLALHLLPQFAIALALGTTVVRSRGHLVDTATMTMFLCSAVLAALHFTLFPLLGGIYLLYLLPLTVVPFVFHFDERLRRIIVKPLTRAMALLLLLALSITAYVGSRLVAGDWSQQDIVAERIARLNMERGGIYLPVRDIEYVTPILEYLQARPPHESFIAFDRLCEAIAFLTGRTTPVGYALKYYEETGFHESDFATIQKITDKDSIDTIIVGKRYLSNSPGELALFASLKKNYTLVLNNTGHFVYQRIPR